MTDLTYKQKEKICRKWCSRENSIELISDDVMLQRLDGEYFSRFQFDIASRRNRREYEKDQLEARKLKNSSTRPIELQAMLASAKHMGLDPSKPDKREILGMVKSGTHHTNLVTFHKILSDCYLLSKAEADKKYMILTDKVTYDHFHKRCKAIMGEIELVYLDTDEHRHLLDGPD